MAKKKIRKVTGYKITVNNNPNYVGIGAGGVQFANGEAKTPSERLANWFREHPGYKVAEILEEVEDGEDETESE